MYKIYFTSHIISLNNDKNFILVAVDIHLYPVLVKTQGGEKLELQVSNDL